MRVERPDRALLRTQSEAEERVCSIVNHLVAGIISIDDHGRFTTFNPGAERIFGYAAKEIIGQNIRMLMPEPCQKEHADNIAKYLRSRDARIIGIGLEVVGLKKDGSTFPIGLAVSPFHLGQRRYLTGIVRDLSEPKRVEEGRRQSEARVELTEHIHHCMSAAATRKYGAAPVKACSTIHTPTWKASIHSTWKS